MSKLCITDLSGLLINEAKPLAKGFGIKHEYKKLMNAKEIDVEILKACVEKIISEASLQEIAEVVDKAEPYEGAVEFLEAVKSRNYDIYIITDNPFAGFPEVKEILKQKFPVEDIYTTSKFNQETLELSGYIPKEQIFTTLYFNYRPENVLGVVQGKNDIALAYEIKRYGGMLIVANSNSRELKKIAEYSVKNTSYLPELVDKIP